MGARVFARPLAFLPQYTIAKAGTGSRHLAFWRPQRPSCACADGVNSRRKQVRMLRTFAHPLRGEEEVYTCGCLYFTSWAYTSDSRLPERPPMYRFCPQHPPPQSFFVTKKYCEIGHPTKTELRNPAGCQNAQNMREDWARGLPPRVADGTGNQCVTDRVTRPDILPLNVEHAQPTAFVCRGPRSAIKNS